MFLTRQIYQTISVTRRNLPKKNVYKVISNTYSKKKYQSYKTSRIYLKF